MQASVRTAKALTTVAVRRGLIWTSMAGTAWVSLLRKFKYILVLPLITSIKRDGNLPIATRVTNLEARHN